MCVMSWLCADGDDSMDEAEDSEEEEKGVSVICLELRCFSCALAVCVNMNSVALASR